MATNKRKPKATPETASAPAPIPAVFVRREKTTDRGPGWRPGDRILRFQAGPGDPLPDLWVEVRALAYQAELTALTSRIYFHDILAFMAPYIVGWNAPGVQLVERVIPAEGELPERTVQDPTDAVLPPPAEGGPDVFAAIASDDLPAVWTWIRGVLIRSAYERPAEEAGAAAA